jgi:hypothetical protein
MEREKIKSDIEKIDDNLTTEEAIFLIEWGFDLKGKNAKKKDADMEG